MTDNKTEGQATSKNSFSAAKYSLSLSDQMNALVEVTEKYKAVADNPVMISQIFMGVQNAFETFNKLLADLNKKLDEIERHIAELEVSRPQENLELTKKDHEILDYVTIHGKATAEEVQEHFGYSGKHAASARLHKLSVLRALEKTHAGRTVYYTAPKNNP